MDAMDRGNEDQIRAMQIMDEVERVVDSTIKPEIAALGDFASEKILIQGLAAQLLAWSAERHGKSPKVEIGDFCADITKWVAEPKSGGITIWRWLVWAIRAQPGRAA